MRCAATKWLPFGVIAGLLWLLYQAVSPHAPLQAAGTLRQIPSFYAETVFDSQDIFDESIFQKKVSLVHIFGTWCARCRDEQVFWLDLAKQWEGGLYALDYKDTRADAQRFLENYGNPYQGVIFDPTGQIAQRWGVVGVPQTYLIDPQGQIRYVHQGPLDWQDFEKTLKPLAEKIRQEYP